MHNVETQTTTESVALLCLLKQVRREVEFSSVHSEPKLKTSPLALHVDVVAVVVCVHWSQRTDKSKLVEKRRTPIMINTGTWESR